MKKMKNFMALLLALVMTMSLVACGNKTSEETKTGEEIGCYVQTTETGEKVLVDKDGKAVTLHAGCGRQCAGCGWQCGRQGGGYHRLCRTVWKRDR